MHSMIGVWVYGYRDKYSLKSIVDLNLCQACCSDKLKEQSKPDLYRGDEKWMQLCATMDTTTNYIFGTQFCYEEGNNFVPNDGA